MPLITNANRRTRLALWSALPLLLAPASRADLVAYWRFDELGGTNAYAAAGGIDGVLQGGAVFVPGAGISGGAVRLDWGTDGFVSFGDHFMFMGSSFSVQIWIKTNPGEANPMIPVGKHNTGYLDGYFLAIGDVQDGIGPSGNTKAHFYVSRPATGPSAIAVNDGRWHQLVGVSNATNGTAQVFVDGTLQGTGSQTGVILNSVPFVVGGISTGGVPSGTFRGLVDEVKLFDHALSTSEVLVLYLETPAPSLSITLTSPAQLQLSWNSVTNMNYQVQFARSLTGTVAWADLGNSISGLDPVTSASAELPDAARFYRVVATPKP